MWPPILIFDTEIQNWPKIGLSEEKYLSILQGGQVELPPPREGRSKQAKKSVSPIGPKPDESFDRTLLRMTASYGPHSRTLLARHIAIHSELGIQGLTWERI